MEMKKIGVILSFIQGLVILVVYMLNPTVVLEQIGAVLLVVMTFMAPSAIFSTEGRHRYLGCIVEGIYIGLILILFTVIQYNIVI